MCQFFSAIACRDGRLLFCEDDSHEEIIRRAGLNDTRVSIRHWVRVEVRPIGEGWARVKVDETTEPAWWLEDAEAWRGRVVALAERVRPAWAAYDAAEASAWAAYAAAVEAARAAYVSAIRHMDGYVPAKGGA